MTDHTAVPPAAEFHQCPYVVLVLSSRVCPSLAVLFLHQPTNASVLRLEIPSSNNNKDMVHSEECADAGVEWVLYISTLVQTYGIIIVRCVLTGSGTSSWRQIFRCCSSSAITQNRLPIIHGHFIVAIQGAPDAHLRFKSSDVSTKAA